jgi:hypothetical protein
MCVYIKNIISVSCKKKQKKLRVAALSFFPFHVQNQFLIMIFTNETADSM